MRLRSSSIPAVRLRGQRTSAGAVPLRRPEHLTRRHRECLSRGGIFANANLTTPLLTKIGNQDAFAIKLDSSGTVTWAKNFGGSGANAYGLGITADESGNVFFGGYFEKANLTTPPLTKIGFANAFAIKTDSSGAVTWTKNFSSLNGANASVSATTRDASANVYLVGNFNAATYTIGSVTLTQVGSHDVFVAKLDTSGTVVWAKNFGGSGATAMVRASQ